MGVTAVMPWNGYMLPPVHHQTEGSCTTAARRFVGRRKLCFDGISTLCDDSHHRISTRTVSDKTFKDLGEVTRGFPTTRRMLLTSLLMPIVIPLQANALGDPSVTIEQVTPVVIPSGALFPPEERIVQLFENNTYSVVNIFDVTLRPQLNLTGVVEIPEGNGSGVVWDEQGHIVTNYHVIGNSLSRNPKPGEVVARVNILASEGVQKNFEGKLIGADRSKDLAVLKVEAPEDLLRPMKVGQSSFLKVGQQCLAIGNPFGFDHTLTTGVISGLNRDILSQTGVTIGGGIQTDAAINPGNSGGPLLDSKGNLIGINTAIFTQTGTSAGVGFAIPSSTVVKIVPQLIQFGRVVRAGLNIEIAPDPVANQLNVRNGALVLLVPANSPAAKVGLRPTTRGFAGNIVLGDVILSVDNKPMLYVDATFRDGFNVPRVRPPIRFWTIELLREREVQEIENGGLGIGELQGPYIEEDIDTMPDDEERFIWKLNKIVETIRMNRTSFEKTLVMTDLSQQYRAALMLKKGM